MAPAFAAMGKGDGAMVGRRITLSARWGALSALVVFAAPAGGARGGCAGPADCSHNGHCLHAGRCECDPGWTGAACGQLSLGDTTPTVRGGNGSWVWGGSPVVGDDGKLHLFFAAMSHGCGLLHYQTNSVVRHAISEEGPEGPWRTLADISLGPRPPGHWDSGAVHGPAVLRDPRSGVFLMYFMGVALAPGAGRPDCEADPAAPPQMNSATRMIGLASSASIAEGSERWVRAGGATGGPILAPRGAGHWDSSDVSNAAPLILENGSVLLGYRAGGDGVALGGGIGIAFAERWAGPYRRIPGADGMLFAAEDGAFFRNPRRGGSFHFLVHRFAAKNGSTAGAAVGGHAYSADGVRGWAYSAEPAYNSTVRWHGNGTTAVLYRRERPKPLLDGEGNLRFLFNGAWPCHVGAEGDDTRDAAAGCETFNIATDVRH